MSNMANAGDPNNRKSSQLSRLRQQLRKKKEALADHFDYRMYMIFHFKQMKPCALFEIAEVVPVMTNNYEESILKGAKNEAYSYESTLELLEKDVVQLHAPRWQSMRKDILGCTTEIDFFLWPRSDISRIECKLFSKWKGEADSSFKPIQASFEFLSNDYEKQLIRLLTRKEKTGLIINNPTQSMFLFVDRQHLETTKRKAIVFKLSSVCLYLPQDQLTNWGAGNCHQIMEDVLKAPLRDDDECSSNRYISAVEVESRNCSSTVKLSNDVLAAQTMSVTSECRELSDTDFKYTSQDSSAKAEVTCNKLADKSEDPQQVDIASSGRSLTVACEHSDTSARNFNPAEPVSPSRSVDGQGGDLACNSQRERVREPPLLPEIECRDNSLSPVPLSVTELSLS